LQEAGELIKDNTTKYSSHKYIGYDNAE